MTTVAWWDAQAGASGDMALGALVGAGVPLDVIAGAVDACAPEPILLRVEDVDRRSMAAIKVAVSAPASTVVRTWPGIRTLLEGAEIDERVRALALAAFSRIASAEALVHGVSVEQVHFHEIGALDTIADVVGVAAGHVWLGSGQTVVSSVALGSGFVRGAHGLLPMPGPAVVAILESAHAPVHGGPGDGERTTPTGAALLATLADSYGPLPAMTVSSVGIGAGERDSDDVANVLRLFVGGAADADADAGAIELAANVDDLDPRLWPGVIVRLMGAGASDAWLVPIVMKKGRPAHTIHALVPASHVDQVREQMFRVTSTLGVRSVHVGKSALDRAFVQVSVDGAPIRVKLGLLGGEIVNAAPEFADVAAAAVSLGRAEKDVLAAATALASEVWQRPSRD